MSIVITTKHLQCFCCWLKFFYIIIDCCSIHEKNLTPNTFYIEMEQIGTPSEISLKETVVGLKRYYACGPCDLCVLCFSHNDYTSHLIFTWNFSYSVWSGIYTYLDFSGAFHCDGFYHFIQHGNFFKVKKFCRVWNLIWFIMVWDLFSFRELVWGMPKWILIMTPETNKDRKWLLRELLISF